MTEKRPAEVNETWARVNLIMDEGCGWKIFLIDKNLIFRENRNEIVSRCHKNTTA